MDSTAFRMELDGATLAAPCLEILLVTGERSAGCVKGVQAAYDHFLAQHQSSLSYYRLNDEAKDRAFDAKAAGIVPFWMKDPKALKQPKLGIGIHAGKTSGRLEPPGLELFFDQGKHPCAHLSLYLPFEEWTWERVQPYVASLSDFPILWGYANFSILWNSGAYEARSVRKWMKPLLKRHPGLTATDPLMYMVRAATGLLQLGWLTFVGGDLLKALGGLGGLKSAAAAKTALTVHALGSKAAVLQAGKHPQLGDVNRGDRVAAYRDAAALLGPVRASRGDMEQVWDEMFEAETADWLERFFVP